MMKSKVVYFWYDHCLLRETGEAEAVTEAIKNHDFKAFCAIRDKYPTTKDICFFPNYAWSFNGEKPRRVYITTEKGFSRITQSEYECG